MAENNLTNKTDYIGLKTITRQPNPKNGPCGQIESGKLELTSFEFNFEGICPNRIKEDVKNSFLKLIEEMSENTVIFPCVEPLICINQAEVTEETYLNKVQSETIYWKYKTILSRIVGIDIVYEKLNGYEGPCKILFKFNGKGTVKGKMGRCCESINSGE